jgi:hypothetical protein
VSAAGSATTAIAAGVMPPQVLGGPVWWYFVALDLLSIGLALYVAIDAWRPARLARLAELREPGAAYRIPSMIYLVMALTAWIPVFPRAWAALPVAFMHFEIVLGFAYLLRVRFPKPRAESPAEDGDPTDSPATHEDPPAS